MAGENEMRAAEIEQQANNAQKQVMAEKRDGLHQANKMNRDADDIKNEALLYKTNAADPAKEQRVRMQNLTMAKRKEDKAYELRAKAKQLESQILKTTRDKDFKIKQMYDSARKLRAEA